MLVALRVTSHQLLRWYYFPGDSTTSATRGPHQEESKSRSEGPCHDHEPSKHSVDDDSRLHSLDKQEQNTPLQRLNRFNEALKHILCDSTGIAAGKVGALFLYWIAAGIAVFVSQYSHGAQYGCHTPILFLAVGFFFTKAVLTQLTWLKGMAKWAGERLFGSTGGRDQSAWVKVGLWLEQHTSGCWTVYEQWLVGYLVFDLWKQVQFQLVIGKEDEWRVMCALGNTIFTPSYPSGVQSPAEIFAPSPVSHLGFATITFSVFVTWLTVRL